ncbi:MAG TPA: pitrilysin family protein [Allosphingosinicella sp.]|nr:pitrilysin family protein [Allosphingosinicella sp.]
MNKLAKAALIALVSTTALGAAPALAQRPAASAPAGRLSVPPLDYKQRKLANGLTIISMRDTTTPNVAVSLWYDVGSKHDPEGRSGFAHLFEHILSRKTVNMPYNMINKLTEDVGGVRNASTWYDRTNYYEIVPARYLETMLWTHAERMARPVVDTQVFENERNVVKEELRQRVLAPPYGRLFNFVIGENSFDTLPNRRPTIGSIEQLDSAKLEDARAFHEAYYGPDTATLIVSGNFDQAQFDRWVDSYFGAVPRRARQIPLAINAREKVRTSPRAVTAYAPNVPLPVAATTWRIPGSADRDMAAIDVLDAILTNGDNSRFYKGLVKTGLSTDASSNLVDIEDGGYYAPYAIVAGGKSVEEVEAAMAAEIDRVRSAPVSAAELAEAKNELIADALRQRETFSGRAFMLGEALVRTGDPKASDKRLAGIAAVTAADVQRVARRYLAANSRVDIRYLDESKRPAGAPDAWTNPVPMPAFASVPPAVRPANALADEGARQAPPAPGTDVPVTPPAISQSKLSTGLDVVTARTGSVPLATMTLVVKGGGSTDPAGKAGLAAMAADLATRGTATRSAEQIAAEMESLGASLNSGAGPDGAVLSVSAPVANLEAAGRVLADIARNATFPTAELERQRKRALDGLTIQMKDPGGLANMIAPSLLYGSAPYGSLATGTPGSLASLTQADLTSYYRKWWHPGNAALVIAGGIDSATASAMAGRLFGDWRGEGPAPVAPASRAGTPQRVRTLLVDLPGAGQAAVIAAVRGVDRADPDYYSLSVANAILGAGSNGRLFEEVRTKRALSYGAYSGMPARADDAVLAASAQTKNETAAEVVQVFLDQLDRLGKEPFAADATAKRRDFLIGQVNRQVETSGGLGGLLAGFIQQGVPVAEAAELTRRIGGVSPEAATAIAARTASARQATIVVVGDSSKFIDKLRAIRPDLEIIPAAELDLDSPTLRRASGAAVGGAR